MRSLYSIFPYSLLRTTMKFGSRGIQAVIVQEVLLLILKILHDLNIL